MTTDLSVSILAIGIFFAGAAALMAGALLISLVLDRLGAANGAAGVSIGIASMLIVGGLAWRDMWIGSSLCGCDIGSEMQVERTDVMRISLRYLGSRRFWRAAPFILAWIAVNFGPTFSAAAEDEVRFMAAQIEVVDGDSFKADGRIYTLAGIEAPEIGQICVHRGRDWNCGRTSTDELKKRLSMWREPIRCFHNAPDATPAGLNCFVGDQEISEILLRAGSVVAKPGAEHHYVAAEHTARQAKIGLWGSRFVMPWLWRRGVRLTADGKS